MLKKFKQAAYRSLRRRWFPEFAEGGKVSFSQCGEDLIAKYIFTLKGLATPSYLDIGANHPFKLSNTALFHNHGSSGINIEANPLLIEEFRKHRPTDINLNIGIGTKRDKLPFFILSDNTLSTFSEQEMRKILLYGRVTLKGTVQIEIFSISEILEQYCGGVFPDFLSIDVEGLDADIIRSTNLLANGPKVICVEVCEYSPLGRGKKDERLVNYIITKGYLEYASTYLNSIFVRNDFWYS